MNDSTGTPSISNDSAPTSSPLRGVVPRYAAAAVAAVALTIAGAFAVDLTVRSAPTEAAAPTSGETTGPPGSTANGEPAPAPAPLAIVSFAYDPLPLMIRPGQSVIVTNQDQAKHTATSGTRDNPDGTFDLKLDGGASGTVAPLAPGSHPYYCSIHPGMKGTIEVAP